MTEFDRGIDPSRRLFRSRFSLARVAEAAFRGLAKGLVAVVILAMLVLSAFAGGAEFPDFPTTRRGRRNLLLIVVAVLAGAYVWFGFL